MLALHGFDAWGLEISQIAVDTAEKYALEELRAPKSYNWGSSKSTDISSIGSARFVCGDFFSEDFSQGGKSTDGDIPQEFDLVYDYTVCVTASLLLLHCHLPWTGQSMIPCQEQKANITMQFLCALPPESRVSWRDRMTSLLTQTGILVCLEFPMYKSLDAEGPPWGLNGVHWNLLTEGGDGRLHDSDETSGSEEVSEGEKMGLFERVLYLRPERTYEVGQRTDMLSVWKLKRGH